MEKDVPYIVYESEAARHERTVKRLITAPVIAILLIVGSNLAWLYVWNQYDFSSESYSRRRGRDAMGRYSSDEGSVDEHTKQELRKLIDQM